MAAHYWLFPWISLFVSLAAAGGGVILARGGEKSSPKPLPSISYFLVWIAAVVSMAIGAMWVGSWGSTDYIPGRGVLAGAFLGLILTAMIRLLGHRSPAAFTASTVGVTTALIAASRLWLTHGEVSGLIAVALSTTVTLIALVVAPSLGSNHRASASLLSGYTVILISSVLIGFTRAGTIGDLYWADMPLLIGASYSVGALVAAAVTRFGAVARSSAFVLIAGVVIAPLALGVAHLLPIIGLTVLGAAAVALPVLLIPRTTNTDAPILLGHLLIIAAVTLAFTLLSGYGLVLIAFGIVFVALIASSGAAPVPVGWVSFAALLLLYRMEILQNGSSVRAIGMADLWDLLAIGLGVLLPRLAVANLRSLDNAAIRWTGLTQWLLTLAVPSLLLDYIWQPRSLTGLFLGLAIGQLTLGKKESDEADLIALTSLAAGLLLFVFLPGLDIVTAPTRNVRIASVATVAVLIVIRILLPFKKSSAKAG